MFIRASILIFVESFFLAKREGGGWLSSLFEGGGGKRGRFSFLKEKEEKRRVLYRTPKAINKSCTYYTRERRKVGGHSYPPLLLSHTLRGGSYERKEGKWCLQGTGKYTLDRGVLGTLLGHQLESRASNARRIDRRGAQPPERFLPSLSSDQI